MNQNCNTVCRIGLPGGPRSNTLFNYVNTTPCKLQHTTHIYIVWTIFTFAINYSPFMCSFILKHFHNYFGTALQCFSTRRLWIKQRSSLINPTVVTKLQFIRIKTELVSIGRRRTTSFDENDPRVVNRNCKCNASNNSGNLNTKGVSLVWSTLYSQRRPSCKPFSCQCHYRIMSLSAITTCPTCSRKKLDISDIGHTASSSSVYGRHYSRLKFRA